METGRSNMAGHIPAYYPNSCSFWPVFNTNKPAAAAHIYYYNCGSAHNGICVNSPFATLNGRLAKEVKFTSAKHPYTDSSIQRLLPHFHRYKKIGYKITRYICDIILIS